MSDLIFLARSIALAAHTDQKYGTEPYSVHLEAADAVLCEFGYTENEDLRAAAWLHDVLEDTSTTASDLINRGIPAYVVALVDAVTDRPGKNRAERHILTYPRIARIPDAVTLKLTDRIANVRASIKRRPDLLEMYRREHADFRDSLQIYGRRDVDMWMALNFLLVKG